MKPINSIVCIKPVPDPNNWEKLKLDPETMLLTRDEIPPVINPLDRNAIEQAVVFKGRFGGTVSVLTMAPSSAEEQLQEALAMGCDEAYLLTDKAFAGADTLATARCLTAAIKKIGEFQFVFCGGFTLDGSTAQVGPQVAELLEIPDLTHVTGIELIKDKVKAWCKHDGGFTVYESDFPVLVTFDKEVNAPRFPNMRGIKEAINRKITVWTARDLGLAPKTIGLKGSPTQMANIYTPTMGRKGEIMKGNPDEILSELIRNLKKDRVLNLKGVK